jgi:LmeA-like phospholipid-binding
MSEEPTRPSPQWQPPQAPQEPPTRVWQPPPQSPPPQSPPPQGPPPQGPPPQGPQQQGPPPQSPPPPAWQAQQPQSPPAPAWQAQAPQDSPPSWPAQPPQDSPPWQGQGGYGSSQGAPAPLRTRRRRRWPWITLIVIVLVLVGADRGALVLTENAMASQFQSSIGLSGKPHVSIPGIPFLTQLIARDFNTVNVSATDETTAGGALEIASLTATAHGMHIHGLNSAEIDQFTASALITFTALGNAGGIPQGITLSADGPNKIQATVNIGPISDSATVQVTQTGPNTVNVHVIDAGGIPTSILGSLMDFTITIPKLPAGVTIQRISITQQGLMITASGSHVTVSQNS